MKTEQTIFNHFPDNDTLEILRAQASAIKALELLDGTTALDRTMAGAVEFIDLVGETTGRAVIDSAIASALIAADMRPKKFKDRDKACAVLVSLDMHAVMLQSYLYLRGLTLAYAGRLTNQLLVERMKSFGFPKQPDGDDIQDDPPF